MINSKDIIHHRFELGLTLEQIAGAVGVSAKSWALEQGILRT